ncbi:MAG: dihydrofolate reductase [Lachnospiraceae bacterium]|nr:dihydrofolate reductase [Lachnospiraceae bacterium]
MTMIAAADNNWAIGNKGGLLIRIPNDHKRFREITTGEVVILGRKTLDTFPGGQPLKNRTNIILSRNKDYAVRDAIVVHSEEELNKCLEDFADKQIYVIGGESIYRLLLPYCDTALITKIDYSYTADAFIPDLSKEGFVLAQTSEEMTCFDIEYRFEKWVRADRK